MMEYNALVEAISIIGTERLLAKKIGVPQSRIQYWKHSAKFIPYDKAIAIYLATNGKVSAESLCPDKSKLTKKWKKSLIDHIILDEELGEIKINIKRIKHKNCIRKTFGNLAGLMKNITEIGLLYPICVDIDFNLVYGERRLRAFELLNRENIPVTFCEPEKSSEKKIADIFFREPYSMEEWLTIENSLSAGSDCKTKHHSDIVNGLLQQYTPDAIFQAAQLLKAQTNFS
ncbi:MAG: helix-turn-helix domain-containing protein [Gammaproteobacteria bacterium]|nr:helix-turn-helix domain-containing protein [Gammaproteobacteria bacterium]